MRFTACVFVLALLGAVPRAYAGPEPWKQGVSPAQQASAQKLLESGNAFMFDHEYGKALEKYGEAIAIWDHPAIRFNMARCLVQLGRFVEAADDLERALQYGPAALEENVYNEALGYQKLLANQTGSIDIDCTQPGVELTLDGKPLLACPGKQSRRVEPGRHQIVGKRAHYLTRTIELFVVGGKVEKASVSLDPHTAGAKITHRWPTWIPWTVFGSGFGVVGVGVLVELAAANTRDRYYDQLARDCAATPCAPDFDSSDKNKAVFENRAAIGVIAAGSAAIAAGVVMLYMNRARTVYTDEHVTAAIAPAPGGASFVVGGRF